MSNKAALAFNPESSAPEPISVAGPSQYRPSPTESSDTSLHSRFAPTIIRALTILLSSFLLFLVQPILAKQILPWFGGTAGVWTICMLFFQIVLLLGYLYAHWLSRLAPTHRAVVHLLLLLASCLTLPIVPNSRWELAHGAAALRILGLLATTVGLPYLLLASTSPLLQSWSSHPLYPDQRRSIYRLFALSNFGSLLGLLSYPFAVEPFVEAHTQGWTWSGAYLFFAACSIIYVWRIRREPALELANATREIPSATAPEAGSYVFWIGCSALGSTLLLAVTNQLTQNVAPIPLLWVVPLCVYLASFSLCFEGRAGRGWYERRLWLAPAMLALGAMSWVTFAQTTVSVYLSLSIPTAGLFVACMLCHGELAQSKPSPAHLTHFYLSLAFGGALGGLFVGLLAPQIFSAYWELPTALVILSLLCLYCCVQDDRASPRTSWVANIAAALVATALILVLLGALTRNPNDWTKIVEGDAKWGCAALLVASTVLLQRYGLRRAVAVTALLCTLAFAWRSYQNFSANTVLAVRNFYGTLRVSDKPGYIRELAHGVIVHGAQIMTPGRRDEPTTYYGRTSGIGRTILSEQRGGQALRIGSIGLGVGTLAAYGRPGDVIRIYELNPAVLDIARHRFTYLADSRARIEPVLGDARLSLESELARGNFAAPGKRFDVLSLDAFSGDAIPLHLLTREAVAIYARVTKPNGIIAFHISNRYLNLAPVIEHLAGEAGFEAVLVSDRPVTGQRTVASDWVLVTKNASFLQRPEIAAHTRPIQPEPGLPEWTDEYTSLLRVIKRP